MRGCPACGKSFRAKELAEIHQGKIYSADDFWYQINCPEKPEEYSFDGRFLKDAHQWNRRRVENAVDSGESCIILDNTNIAIADFCCYATYAHLRGYSVTIEEPTSPWWLEMRKLLSVKEENEEELKIWAENLAKINEKTHKVPAKTIEKMIRRWQNVVDLEQLMTDCQNCHFKN